MPTPIPRIVEFESIDSTNTEAHRRAAVGERGPLWLRADQQEQARGRSGRHWSSPSGNFSATYAFVPEAGLTILHQLSFVSGLAVYDAIAPQLNKGAALQLKWPNDLLIEGAKVGGILVETSRYDTDIVVMIGIGINVAHAPVVQGRATTHLSAHGCQLSPSQLLNELANSMSVWLARWHNGAAFADIRHAWQQRAHQAGQPLSVNTNNRQVAGLYSGLAENGALQLTIETGETISIEHGDVSLVASISDLKERA